MKKFVKRKKTLNCFQCGEDYEWESATHFLRKKCPACEADQTSFSRWRLYRLTKDEQDRLLESQNGLCALCDRKPAVLDHNHETGRARGFLCRRCNFSIAILEKDPEWIHRALEYIDK